MTNYTKLAPTLYEVTPLGAYVRIRIGTGRGGFEWLMERGQADLFAEALTENGL